MPNKVRIQFNNKPRKVRTPKVEKTAEIVEETAETVIDEIPELVTSNSVIEELAVENVELAVPVDSIEVPEGSTIDDEMKIMM
jgi:P4 family phage/plasmid primase-like protien